MLVKTIKRIVRKVEISNFKNEADIINYKNNAWNSTKAAKHYKEVVESVFFENVTLPIFQRYMDNNYCALDVGCGTGRLTQHLVNSVKEVTAVDYSESMLDLIDDYPNLRKKVGDGHKLPFDNNTFDAVFSLDFLAHFPTWDALLAEQIRVLKPSGTLVCNYVSKDNELEFKSKMGGNKSFPVVISETGTTISKDELDYFCRENNCTLTKLIPLGIFWTNDIYTGFMSREKVEKLSKDFLISFVENELFRNRIIKIEKTLAATEDPSLAPRGILVIKKNN